MVNQNKIFRKNIKKVFRLILRNIAMITDNSGFDIEIDIQEKKLSQIYAENGEVRIIYKRDEEEQNNYLKIYVGQQEQSSLFLSCLMEAFQKDCESDPNYCINFHKQKKNYRQIKKEQVNRIYQNGCRIFSDRLKKYFCLDMEILQHISSLYYEGDVCQGWLFFSVTPKVNLTFAFSESGKKERRFEKYNSRGIRKMLEITGIQDNIGNPTALVFSYSSLEGWEMTGLTDVNIEETEGIWIHFTAHMVWEMGWKKNKIVRSRSGFLEFPIQQLKQQFMEKIKKQDDKVNADRLWSIVEAARKQSHGTILIIYYNGDWYIQKEVERLIRASSGNHLEKKVVLDEKLIQQISSIDGAVLMDTDQNVYAYGVVLDGNAEIKGEPSRGARYNCSYKYIASLSSRETAAKALAVIISEDGMVNFYDTEDYRRSVEDGKH